MYSLNFKDFIQIFRSWQSMVAIIRDRTITNTCHFNLLHIIIITWTKLNSLLSGNQQLKWALMQYYCVLRKRYQSTIFSSIYLRVRYNELYKGNWLICGCFIFYCDSTAPGIRIPVCCIYILVLNALKMSLMIKNKWGDSFRSYGFPVMIHLYSRL